MSAHDCEQLLSEILAKKRTVHEAGVSKSTQRVMRDLQEALAAAHAAMDDIATTVQEMREENTASITVETTDVAPPAKKPKRTHPSSEWTVLTRVLSTALSRSDEVTQDKSMRKITKVASVLKTTFPALVTDIFRQASDTWKPHDASILRPSHMQDRVSWNAWVETLREQPALAPLFAQMQDLHSKPLAALEELRASPRT